MKKNLVLTIIILAVISFGINIQATENKPYKLEKNEKVGYVIEDGYILGCDMKMWWFEDAESKHYVIFNLEADTFRYISQDEAEELACLIV